MQPKMKLLLLCTFLFSLFLKAEINEEIIVLEKKISNLSGWSENLSISSVNSSDLN